MAMGWIGGVVAANMMCTNREYPKNTPQGKSVAEIILDNELAELHTLEEKRDHLIRRKFINDKIIPQQLVEGYLFIVERDLEIKQSEEHAIKRTIY